MAVLISDATERQRPPTYLRVAIVAEHASRYLDPLLRLCGRGASTAPPPALGSVPPFAPLKCTTTLVRRITGMSAGAGPQADSWPCFQLRVRFDFVVPPGGALSLAMAFPAILLASEVVSDCSAAKPGPAYYRGVPMLPDGTQGFTGARFGTVWGGNTHVTASSCRVSFAVDAACDQAAATEEREAPSPSFCW